MSTTNTQTQLLELFHQHSGWLNTRILQRAKLPRISLLRLLEQGLIERAQRGVYPMPVHFWSVPCTYTV
jgi:hypothetical protein